MGRVDRAVREIAGPQHNTVTRAEVFAAGGADHTIASRVSDGAWSRVHAGVYRLQPFPETWEASLLAAVKAAGYGALASHRAALVLWEMDGLRAAPVEITAPYSNRPIPRDVVVHRTRRSMEPSEIRGIRVTTAERTLLDCAALLPSMVIAKAVESAVRKRITTTDRLNGVLAAEGGRGVRGTRKLRWVIAQRVAETATGSGSETELLFHIRREGLPEPVLQHEVVTAEGDRFLLDLCWPDQGKAVEVDGLDAHDSADALDSDLKRQNALMDLGIDLRRFSAREVRRNPAAVVDRIRRFLGA